VTGLCPLEELHTEPNDRTKHCANDEGWKPYLDDSKPSCGRVDREASDQSDYCPK
jgi:hypothetical protein